MLDIKIIHKELKRLGFSFNGGRNCRFYWNSEKMEDSTEQMEFQADRMSGGWFSFMNYFGYADERNNSIQDEAYNLELKERAKDYIVIGYPEDNVLDVRFNRVK